VRRKWTELPLPSEVIDGLDEMTKDKTECEELSDEIENVNSEGDIPSQNENAEELDAQFVEVNDSDKNHNESETQNVETLETNENELNVEESYFLRRLLGGTKIINWNKRKKMIRVTGRRKIRKPIIFDRRGKETTRIILLWYPLRLV
jgi:hypothetical protein